MNKFEIFRYLVAIFLLDRYTANNIKRIGTTSFGLESISDQFDEGLKRQSTIIVTVRIKLQPN